MDSEGWRLLQRMQQASKELDVTIVEFSNEVVASALD